MLFPFSTIESHLSKRPPLGVIHVGGHTGEEVPLYLERGWKVAIFEPQAAPFGAIPTGPTITKHNVALGATNTTVALNCASNYQSSSVLAPKTHLQEHPHVRFNGSVVAVPQRTLDEYSLDDYGFLMLDVQGYELEVLKGATKTLQTIDHIYAEVNERELYAGCVLLPELDDWLRERGFVRVHTTMTAHGWGDAFYTRP